MKIKQIMAAGLMALAMGTPRLCASDTEENINRMETLNLTSEWDKTFPKSNKVEHSRVTFVNRYGITLAAEMYKPKGAGGKLPAIAEPAKSKTP